VSTCVAKGSALVPAFSPQQVTVNSVTAPLLTSTQITRVKARGLVLTSRIARDLRRRALRLRSWAQPRQGMGPPASTYLHPGGLMGHVELALMQYRLNSSISPQSGALESMLSGTSVGAERWRGVWVHQTVSERLHTPPMHCWGMVAFGACVLHSSSCIRYDQAEE